VSDKHDRIEPGPPPVSGGSEEAERLKACPACGSESGAIQAAFDLLDNPTWEVYCGRCGYCRGGPCYSPRYATKNWNALPRDVMNASPASMSKALDISAETWQCIENAVNHGDGRPSEPVKALVDHAMRLAREVRQLRARLAARPA
jgi:hypothetical protein